MYRGKRDRKLNKWGCLTRQIPGPKQKISINDKVRLMTNLRWLLFLPQPEYAYNLSADGPICL
ncbi:MAG: hypothetical protein CM15mP111_4580 [Hyphomicrobiales bacterium]|nr:MAG: hypothetical protein CM15mP111_4580 [Hyphomicrobiales bacterium]